MEDTTDNTQDSQAVTGNESKGSHRLPKRGDIVDYHLKEDEHDDDLRNNYAKVLPAMVIVAFGGTAANLRIFTDGDEVGWRTSVPMFDTTVHATMGGTWQFRD